MKTNLTMIVLICLTMTIVTSVDNGNSSFGLKNYEQLTISEDHYRLKISYEDVISNLPKSLKLLFKEMSIQAIVLQMGFINPSSFQTRDSFSSSNNFLPFITHGSSLIIKNTTHLSNQNFQSLAQVFSISRDQKFMLYLPEISSTFVSNPNDKFCAQHLKAIVDLFMSCKNVAGIGAIINDKTFFVGKAFAGIKLQWTIEQGINLVFYLDKKSQQVKNYLKLSQQKRQTKRCMHFDELIVKKQQNLQQSNLTFSSEKNSLSSIIYTSSIQTQFHSNYYNPQKSLLFRINLSSLRKDISSQSFTTDQGDIKRVLGRILFPKGFQIEKISYNCSNQCSQFLQKIDSQVLYMLNEQKYISEQSLDSTNRNKLIKFEITLFPNNISIASYPELQLRIQYKSHLKPFEEYETIAGGGQEFSNIPLTVDMGNNRTLMVSGHKNRNMFDRLLEPDFSIPFKTITFTIAIFGYLWIAIWKAFYSQVQSKPSILKFNQKSKQSSKTLQNKSEWPYGKPSILKFNQKSKQSSKIKKASNQVKLYKIRVNESYLFVFSDIINQKELTKLSPVNYLSKQYITVITINLCRLIFLSYPCSFSLIQQNHIEKNPYI